MKMSRLIRTRLMMTIFGTIACSVAIAVFKKSGFGLDPFQCLSQGVYIPFTGSISFGNYYIIWSAIIVLLDVLLDKKQLGPATLAHMFLTGYVVDGSMYLLDLAFPEPGLALRIGMMLVGIVVCCLGASLYFTSAMGVSCYDAISLALDSKHLKLGGKQIPFRFWRIGCDVLCVLGGMCFGLMPGIGTLITAFFMGPLIELFKKTVAVPMLEKAKNGK